MASKINLTESVPGLWRIIQTFLPQIRKQRSLLIVSFFALLAETVLRVLEPWPLKFIFDKVILVGVGAKPIGVPLLDKLEPMALLTLLALSLVVIAGFRGAASYFSTVGMALAATHVMTDIRGDLYNHLQRLSLSFHSKAKSGDLITRVTYDVERLREVTVVAALPLVTNVLTLLGMVGVMLSLNWELALIAIAICPLFLFSTAHMGKQIRKVARRQRKREGAMAATAAEAIGAIKVVQALSLQGMLESSFSKQNQESLKEGAEAQKLAAGLERTVEVLVAIATSMVLWRGTQLVLKGVVTPGDLLIFITYLKVAFKPMRQLAKYTGQISKAIASGERIIDLLDTAPAVQDSRGAIEALPFKGLVEFDRVKFAYDAENGILRNLTFRVQPGQRVALVGPSGGGKSTLVSLLLRLYDPLEGGIWIDGHDLREYKLESLRRQISIVLQDSVLFAASIRDNIAYGALGTVSDIEIEAAARLSNAHDFIMAMPEGYDTLLGERGSTLSGGQRQRLAIARAAIRQAPVIILDEPTTGLDQENEHLVSEALERLSEGRTTFWISHNLKATTNADCIFYIENGKLLEEGKHSELLRLGGRYAAMYALQSAVNDQSASTPPAISYASNY